MNVNKGILRAVTFVVSLVNTRSFSGSFGMDAVNVNKLYKIAQSNLGTGCTADPNSGEWNRPCMRQPQLAMHYGPCRGA